MPDPIIYGGKRVTCTAAIMCGCILLYGLVMIILASFPLRPALADPHAGAGFFLECCNG